MSVCGWRLVSSMHACVRRGGGREGHKVLLFSRYQIVQSISNPDIHVADSISAEYGHAHVFSPYLAPLGYQPPNLYV